MLVWESMGCFGRLVLFVLSLRFRFSIGLSIFVGFLGNFGLTGLVVVSFRILFCRFFCACFLLFGIVLEGLWYCQGWWFIFLVRSIFRLRRLFGLLVSVIGYCE